MPVPDIQPPQTGSSFAYRFVAGRAQGGSFDDPVNGRSCEIEEVCLDCLLSFARDSAKDQISHGDTEGLTDPTSHSPLSELVRNNSMNLKSHESCLGVLKNLRLAARRPQPSSPRVFEISTESKVEVVEAVWNLVTSELSCKRVSACLALVDR